MELRSFDWPCLLVFWGEPWLLVGTPFVLEGFVERRLSLAVFISLLKCVRFNCWLVLGFEIALRVIRVERLLLSV